MTSNTKAAYSEAKQISPVVTGAVLGAVGTAVALFLTHKQTRDQMKKQFGGLKKIAADSVDHLVKTASEISPGIIEDGEAILKNGDAQSKSPRESARTSNRKSES